MARVHHDAALRDALSARGLERARGFTWEACAQGVLEVLRSIASGRAPASPNP